LGGENRGQLLGSRGQIEGDLIAFCRTQELETQLERPSMEEDVKRHSALTGVILHPASTLRIGQCAVIGQPGGCPHRWRECGPGVVGAHFP